jgi:uncharacterized protein (TIGR03435 family)
MTFRADRPVIDQTGIEGYYRIELKWDYEGQASENQAFIDAVQRTLRLRLVKRELPNQILVIDSIRRVPTEN